MTRSSDRKQWGATREAAPGLARRSIVLVAFFTLVSPLVGVTLLLILPVSGAFGENFLSDIPRFFYLGVILGAPFSGLCAIILAVIVAYRGGISAGVTVLATLAAVIVVHLADATLTLYAAVFMNENVLGWLLMAPVRFILLTVVSVPSTFICYLMFKALPWSRPLASA